MSKKGNKALKTLGIICLLSVVFVSSALADIGHGTSDKWLGIGDVNNSAPADYEINKDTQGVARDGEYNKYFLKEDIQEVYIDIAENNLNYLLQNAKEEPYVMTDSVTIGDTTISYCGLKTKGDYTLYHSYEDNYGSDRFSFTINFGKFINKDRYGEKQTFYGCEKISFNNFFFDKSMMKEFVAYKLMEEMGLPTPQFGLAKLYINGEYYGVYFMVEALEESILEQYYNVKDVDGYLGKPNGTTLIYNELKSNPQTLCDNDESKLSEIEDELPIALEWSRKLTYLSEGKDFDGKTIDVNSDEYVELLGEIMNVDEAIRYFATHSWLCQFDSMFAWTKNFGLFISEDGYSTIIPWDYDLSFGCYGDNPAEKTANHDIDKMYTDGFTIYNGSKDDIYNNYPLFKVIYQNQELMEKYYEYMGDCSKIAALGGTVESTEVVYGPGYLAAYIAMLRNPLLVAAEEALAENVYYMNGISQPNDVYEALPNLSKIIAMRAVGVKLQLEESEYKVTGAGCDLGKLGNGVSGSCSIYGDLTSVDATTGIYVSTHYGMESGEPVLTVKELSDSDEVNIKIEEALKKVNVSKLKTYEMSVAKQQEGGYTLTIPLSIEHMNIADELTVYSLVDGKLKELEISRSDNLITVVTEVVEHIVLAKKDTVVNTEMTNIDNKNDYILECAMAFVLIVVVTVGGVVIYRLKKGGRL